MPKHLTIIVLRVVASEGAVIIQSSTGSLSSPGKFLSVPPSIANPSGKLISARRPDGDIVGLNLMPDRSVKV